MVNTPLPAINVPHIQPSGLRQWRPAFETLQIEVLAHGRRTVTVNAHGSPVVFVLERAAAEHLACLLLDDGAATPAPQAA